MSGSIMVVNCLSSTEAVWENHRDEITRLYVTENKALKDVILQMQTLHGFQASVSAYKRQLSRWGIQKYMTRPVAFRLLQAADTAIDDQNVIDEELTASNGQLPNLKQYLRRNRVPDRRQWLVPMQSGATADGLERIIPLPQPWNTHASFLHSVGVYIQKSCEHQLWHYPNYELQVESSRNQRAEKTALQNFIHGINTGRAMKRCGSSATAFQYWRYASRQIDHLVRGSYHDILPNLLLKLCELCDDGELQLAQLFMTQIAEFSMHSRAHQTPESAIYKHFQTTDVADLPALYERVMNEFISQFEVYFPPYAYNNHVMRNNLTRRRLKSLLWTTFGHELPDVDHVAADHGRYNRRALDVLALHAECALERGLLHESDTVAASLIDRASHINDDHWLRMYYLFQGYYIRGCAMHRARNPGAAEHSLKACLHLLDTFRELPFGSMFDTERLDALQRLAGILTAAGRFEEAAPWIGQWEDMVQDMQNIDFAALST